MNNMRFFLVLGCLLFSTQAKAYYTANDLQNSCQTWLQWHNAGLIASADAHQVGICEGMFMGAIGVFQSLNSPNLTKFPRPCTLPASLPLEQAIKIFLKWANDNPDQLNDTAADAALAAQIQGFCR